MSDHQIRLEEILPYLPLQNKKSCNGYVSACCPFHMEKHNSFVIYDSGFFKCFSCGEIGNLYKLTKHLTGKDPYEILNIDRKEFRSFLFTKKNEIIRKSIDLNQNRSFEIKGNFYDVFNNDSVMTYLRERNITNKFINDFKIKYTEKCTINKTFFKDRIIIPIFEDKKIIAYEGRDFTRKQDKKVLYSKGSSVNTLFNIDNLNRNEILYLVEGIMDIPTIYSFISRNVSSVFGIAITKKQSELLSEFKEIIVIPDTDLGGERFISILDSLLNKEFWIASLKISQDPGKAPLIEIQEAINSKVISSEYFLKKYNMNYKRKSLNW